MSNFGRNAPCQCGSGKKYKKCCLPRLRIVREKGNQIMEEAKNVKLNNTYRDEQEAKAAVEAEAARDPLEVEEELVGIAEMVKRDTYVCMRIRQIRERCRLIGVASSSAIRDMVQGFLDELTELPLSSAKISTQAAYLKQREQLIQVLASAEQTGEDRVILQALELAVNCDLAEDPSDAYEEEQGESVPDELADEEPAIVSRDSGSGAKMPDGEQAGEDDKDDS